MKYSLWLIVCLGIYGHAQADDLVGLDEHEILNFNNIVQQDPSLNLVEEPPDYKELFTLGNKALREGNIEQAIDCFQRSIQDNDRAPQTHFNLGYSYEKKGDVDPAIEKYKDAILLKLDYKQAHLQLANLLQQKSIMDEAIIHYQHAINLDPGLIDEALKLARLLCAQERFPESLPYFERVAKSRPNDIAIKFEYANTLNTSAHNEKALKLYFELLKVRSNDSNILYNTAFTLKKLGKITEAIPYYQKALTLNPNHTEAHFSLGLTYLISGDFNRGWKEYEYRWQRNSQLQPRNFPKPQWDGSSLDNKTLLIHAEQGLGDTFQFIRYAKEVKELYNCKIICAVQRPLHTIISRCCPYIDRVTTLSDIPTSFDVHIPLMSLPLLFKTEENTIPKTFPYIFPDENLVETWREKLAHDTNFKVGICWQGNSRYSTPFLRAAVAAKSLQANKFAPLSDVPDISLYSLQKETGVEQLKSLSSRLNLKTFDEDFDQTNGRFMDTAALIKNLDLVITVDTSIAHLAGALGTPVWIMLPEPADWRWLLNRSDTPWYLHNTKLFRQPKPGDWNSVIETVVEELKKLIGAKDGTIAPRQITKESQQQIMKTIIKHATHNTNHLELDLLNKLLTAKTQYFRGLPIDDHEAFIREIKIAYHLQKLREIIQKESA